MPNFLAYGSLFRNCNIAPQYPNQSFLYGMPIRALPVERRGNTVTLFPKKIAKPPAG
jgi:hypothetical protein